MPSKKATAEEVVTPPSDETPVETPPEDAAPEVPAVDDESTQDAEVPAAPPEDTTPVKWETEPAFDAIGVAPTSAQRQLAARIANARLASGMSRREALGEGIATAIEWEHRGGPANNYQ